MSNLLLYKGKKRLCGYWPKDGIQSQNIFLKPSVPLNAGDARALKFGMLEHGLLTNMEGGHFPICPDCPVSRACRNLRIDIGMFSLSRSDERRLKLFTKDMEFSIEPAVFNGDYYALYKRYINARHGDTATEMKNADQETYKRITLDMSAWQLVARDKQSKRLVSVAWVDQHKRDFTLEYLAYDLENAKKSPGISSVLFLAHSLKTAGDRHLYLGSWSPGSPKLDYKQNFKGLEIHTPQGWVPFDRDRHASAPPVPGYRKTGMTFPSPG